MSRRDIAENVRKKGRKTRETINRETQNRTKKIKLFIYFAIILVIIELMAFTHTYTDHLTNENYRIIYHFVTLSTSLDVMSIDVPPSWSVVRCEVVSPFLLSLSLFIYLFISRRAIRQSLSLWIDVRAGWREKRERKLVLRLIDGSLGINAKVTTHKSTQRRVCLCASTASCGSSSTAAFNRYSSRVSFSSLRLLRRSFMHCSLAQWSAIQKLTVANFAEATRGDG